MDKKTQQLNDLYASVKSGKVSSVQSSDQMGWLPQVTGALSEPIADLLGVGAGALAAPETAGVGSIPAFLATRALVKGGLGAIGQGGGEAVREKITGQNLDTGKILNQAGQGALWNQLPGGELAKNIPNFLLRQGAKAGIRGVGGAAIGAGTQALQNVQNNQPLGQNVSQSALNTGGATAIAGPAVDVLGAGAKWAFGEIPGQVKERMVTLPIKAEKEAKLNMALNDAGSLVGDKNYQYAVNEGIIPSEMGKDGKLIPNSVHTKENTVKFVQDALDKRTEKAKQVEETLQAALENRPPLTQINRDLLRGNLATEFDPVESQLNPALSKKLSKMVKSANLDTLGKVNELKRNIGEFYSKSPTARGLYGQLKTYIEEHAGDSSAVKGLNEEAYQLMDMRKYMEDLQAKGAPRTEKEMQDAINASKTQVYSKGEGMSSSGMGSILRNLPTGLQKASSIGGGLAAVLGPLMGKMLLAPADPLLSGAGLAASAGGLGGYFALKSAATHLTETPAGQEWLAKNIDQIQKHSPEIGKALRQLMVRDSTGNFAQ